MDTTQPRAIIADDEEHIRVALRQKIARAWPELHICGEATNGQEALEMATDRQPDIAFLDIKMPGLSGLEVAARIADRCHLVFITAFDQYAVDAFEREAIDYLLKPVHEERLAITIARLKTALSRSDGQHAEELATIRRLLAELGAKEKKMLTWLRVQDGDGIRLIAADHIWFFKAEDKYTTVVSQDGEWLLRKSITQLTEELDNASFWRIHRGIIVNVRQISRVTRSFTGGLSLTLKDCATTLPVSRGYAHLFRQM